MPGSLNDEAFDIARCAMAAETQFKSRCERNKIEIPFGDLKHVLKLDRRRCRGNQKGHDTGA
tara:strand:- start:131 stop:316 length:186 start_codon:yes stop_codon:yes gene_type:complete